MRARWFHEIWEIVVVVVVVIVGGAQLPVKQLRLRVGKHFEIERDLHEAYAFRPNVTHWRPPRTSLKQHNKCAMSAQPEYAF